jgi:hypothetical protein
MGIELINAPYSFKRSSIFLSSFPLRLSFHLVRLNKKHNGGTVWILRRDTRRGGKATRGSTSCTFEIKLQPTLLHRRTMTLEKLLNK